MPKKSQNSNKKEIKLQRGNQTLEASQSVAGPLPSAEEMAGYNKISPYIIETILEMAKNEAHHRHDHEKEALNINENLAKKQFTERRIGQFLGLGVTVLCLIVCVFLAYLGAMWPSSIVGGSTLIGLVAAFVNSRNNSSK